MQSTVLGTLVAAGFPAISPNPNGIPGANTLAGFASGAQFIALGLCVLGILIGAAVWAVGSHSQHHSAHKGRIAVLVSSVATLLVGGAVAIANFGFTQGGTFH